MEGVTFYVRYLGSCFVINKAGDETTSEAIKSIVSMARKTDRKLNRVALLVSVSDVRMTDLETGQMCFDISIYRISYCCADALFSHVFAFIAVNKDETMECHAFLCRKRKIAQAASLTVAQAFNLAFSSWKDNQERKTENGNSAVAVTCCDQPSSCSIKVKPSPASREISEEAEESLLIDLRSPGDSLEDKTLATAFLVRLDSKEDYQQEEDMDLSFAKLPNTPTNVPILRHLPANAASLDVGAFAGSRQTIFSSSPRDSPLHGSCLTPSQLLTPVNSPLTSRQLSSGNGNGTTVPLSPLLNIHKLN